METIAAEGSVFSESIVKKDTHGWSDIKNKKKMFLFFQINCNAIIDFMKKSVNTEIVAYSPCEQFDEVSFILQCTTWFSYYTNLHLKKIDDIMI